MARIRKWNGDEIRKSVEMNMASAMGEFGLRVEGYAKKELKKSEKIGKRWVPGGGHGVRTGTLRRSIHCAQPGYNWSGDDVKPGSGTPERGGQKFEALVNGRKITIEVGSGLDYALPVHQGHHSFEGYHFLTIGLEKAKPEMPIVLSRHKLK